MAPSSKPEKIYFDLPLDTLRSLAGWAADCAARALPIYAELIPADPRPRTAIEGACLFACGGKRDAGLRKHAMESLRASTAAGQPAASAAARSASLAAASAYTHPFVDLKQVVHIIGPAAYTALALEQHHGGDEAVGDDFVREAVRLAPPDVSRLLLKMPARQRGKTRLNHLLFSLDQRLRAGGFELQPPDPAWVIHPLQIEQVEELQTLLEACADFVLLVEGQAVSPSAARETFEETPPNRSAADKFLYGIRNQAGRLVGVLEGMRAYPDDSTCWIGLFMLSPSIRGNGLGLKIVDSFAAFVREHGAASALMLGVVEGNLPGLRFWQRAGFEKVRETEPRVFGQKTQRVIVMRRLL